MKAGEMRIMEDMLSTIEDIANHLGISPTEQSIAKSIFKNTSCSYEVLPPGETIKGYSEYEYTVNLVMSGDEVFKLESWEASTNLGKGAEHVDFSYRNANSWHIPKSLREYLWPIGNFPTTSEGNLIGILTNPNNRDVVVDVKDKPVGISCLTREIVITFSVSINEPQFKKHRGIFRVAGYCEGSNAELLSYEVTLPCKVSELMEAIDNADDDGKEEWNATHGCEYCHTSVCTTEKTKHGWKISWGSGENWWLTTHGNPEYRDEEWEIRLDISEMFGEGRISINPDCDNCKGKGRII